MHPHPSHIRPQGSLCTYRVIAINLTITGSITTKDYRKNAGAKRRRTIFTGSWLAPLLRPQLNLFSRISSLNAGCVADVTAQLDRLTQRGGEGPLAASRPSRSENEVSASIVLRPARVSAPRSCGFIPSALLFSSISLLIRSMAASRPRPASTQTTTEIEEIRKRYGVLIEQFALPPRG